MSPERKEKTFDFQESFHFLSGNLIDELRRSKTKVTTVASFKHGSLNFHENGRWTAWLELVKEEVPVKPSEPNWVIIYYMLVKDPVHYLDELKKLNAADKFDRTDIELVVSNELKVNLQKEFIGTMQKTLAGAKKLPTSRG